jgi:hypothetical protein|tara:strand:+ start:330 stop:503 length:174 start_codon:yes stop_codon:yes gene_type:complete
MQQGIYILCLLSIAVFVGLIAGNFNEKEEVSKPIPEPVIEEVIEEKVYEKYEMGNYR